MNMGDRIRELRKQRGLTQEELAAKLGLKDSAIAKYENGRVENIKRSIISNMASVLECSPTYLLCLDDVVEPAAVDFIISDDEKELILEYRKADEASRDMVKRLLAYADALKK